MCTLIVASGVWPEVPLLIATNRDERLSRPSEPPFWQRGEEYSFFAPRDAQAGGTWLGLNENGLFAGLTNRFNEPSDPAHRSRGEIVSAMLDTNSHDAAIARLKTIQPADYNGFHLVVADHRQASVAIVSKGELTINALAPGTHIFSERSFQNNKSPREETLRKLLAGWVDAPPPSPASLKALLSVHAEPSFDGACVHLDGYGTRSSTLLYAHRTLPHSPAYQWLHAEGSPCDTPYLDLSLQLQSGWPPDRLPDHR
jgi:uncharacterized protein with NRDE domain